MNNKTFFLIKISALFAATHILLSSCATTPAVTSSSSSSISTVTETTDKSTTTPIAQESKYKVQIKKQNEIIESITPAVFSTEYPLDLNYGGNGWDMIDSIISDVSGGNPDVGQISAFDLTVISADDKKAEVEGVLIYTLDGVFFSIYASNQLPQLPKGTYYAVAIIKNKDTAVCFKVIQENEPIKKYFMYEDAENEKGIIIQGDDPIEVPSLLYDHSSIYSKGYIDMCIYTTPQSNIKAYVEKYGEPTIISSQNGPVSFFGGYNEKTSGLYIFKDTGTDTTERFESVDASSVDSLEKGDFYCLFTWGGTGRFILGINETYSFCAAFKYIVE